MQIKTWSLTLAVYTAILFTVSCKKDSLGKEFCLECSIKTTISINDPNDVPSTGESTISECGLTQKDMNELLSAGNTTSTSTNGGVTLTTKTITTCTKK